MQIKLIPENDGIEEKTLANYACEVQVCSMLAHVWNEIEHDTRYKAKENLSFSEKASLQAFGLLVKSGDAIISNLINAREIRKEKEYEQEKYGLTKENFHIFLSENYPMKKINYRRHATSTFEAFELLNLAHRKGVTLAVTQVAFEDFKKKHIKKFNAFFMKQNIKQPAFEIDSCDEFLLALIHEKNDELLQKGKQQKINMNKRYMAFSQLYQKYQQTH